MSSGKRHYCGKYFERENHYAKYHHRPVPTCSYQKIVRHKKKVRCVVCLDKSLHETQCCFKTKINPWKDDTHYERKDS